MPTTVVDLNRRRQQASRKKPEANRCRSNARAHDDGFFLGEPEKVRFSVARDRSSERE